MANFKRKFVEYAEDVFDVEYDEDAGLCKKPHQLVAWDPIIFFSEEPPHIKTGMLGFMHIRTGDFGETLFHVLCSNVPDRMPVLPIGPAFSDRSHNVEFETPQLRYREVKLVTPEFCEGSFFVTFEDDLLGSITVHTSEEEFELWNSH